MRSLAVVLLAVAAAAANAEAEKPRPAYSAIGVVTVEGKTFHSTIYSDGVHLKTILEDGKSGSYTDDSLNTKWQWGPTYGCIHLSASGPENAKKTEERLGTETVDGHPTQKVKVTTRWTDPAGKPVTYVETVWRATDLQDLVIRSRSDDGKRQVHLEHIVVGKPDAKLVAFPSPPCNASEAMTIAAARPKSGGGYRTIRFDQGACELIVPMRIAMSIPSDYTVRSVRQLGCFWGAEDDLARLLQSGREADFTSIRRGVFWVRPAPGTEYNPALKRFVSDAGPHDKWAETYRSIGAKNVVVTARPVGVFPSARVTMTAKGQRVYMFYLAVPNTDSIALLINYHPAGSGGPADDAVWKAFVDSVNEVKE